MKKRKQNRMILVASLICLLVLMGGAATVALSIGMAGPVVNTFKSASIDTQISERFDADLTKIVNVTNSSRAESDAFVRVRISCSPEAIESALEVNAGENDLWAAGEDGFYYYLKPLAPGEATEQEIMSRVREGKEGDTSKDTLYGLGLHGIEFDIVIYQEAVAATEKGDAQTGMVDLEVITGAFAAAK